MSTAAEVIPMPFVKPNSSADELLADASNREFDRVVIFGILKNGSPYLVASPESIADRAMMLDIAKDLNTQMAVEDLFPDYCEDLDVG